MAAGLVTIARGHIVEPPVFLTQAVDAIGEWFARHGARFARATP
jgi:hypothetical protein